MVDGRVWCFVFCVLCFVFCVSRCRRHDPCVVNRAIPIVEAMAALVLADAALGQLARDASAPRTDKPASTTPLPQKPLPTPEEMAAAAAKVDAASGSGPSSWDAKAATAAEPPAKKQKT